MKRRRRQVWWYKLLYFQGGGFEGRSLGCCRDCLVVFIVSGSWGQRKMNHFCQVLEWPLLGDMGMWKWPDKGFVQMQKNCTTAIWFHNCKKIAQLLFHFTTAKFYVGIIQKNVQLLFHFTTAKKMHNCKTNAQQQKNCTTAKQTYCNTKAEALTGYSSWEIIFLLLFSLAFHGKSRTQKGTITEILRNPNQLIITSKKLTNEQAYKQTADLIFRDTLIQYTRCAWAGGTFFPVVLLWQLLDLAGNRFWFYILAYLEYHTVVALC
jgi:hypothetical protein